MLSDKALVESILAVYARRGHMVVSTSVEFAQGEQLPPEAMDAMKDDSDLMRQYRWIVTGWASVSEFVEMARDIHQDPDLRVWWAYPGCNYYKVMALD